MNIADNYTRTQLANSDLERFERARIDEINARRRDALKSLSEDVEHLGIKQSQVIATIDKAATTFTELQKTNENLRREIEAHESWLKKSRGAKQYMEEELDNLQCKLYELKEDIEAHNIKKQELTISVNNLTRLNESTQQEIYELQKTQHAIRKDIARCNRNLDQLKDEVKSNNIYIQTSKQELASMKEEIEKEKEALKTYNQRLDLYAARIQARYAELGYNITIT